MTEQRKGRHALLLAGLAALIVMISSAGARAEANGCTSPPEALAKFQPADGAAVESDVAILQDGEREVRLADWRGSGLVVNFWATWCPPCVEEMPALDALHADIAGDGIAVLAVSSDFGGADAVRAFYEKTAIKNLGVLMDPRSRMGQSLDVYGLPTTLLVDAEGKEVGRVIGRAEWNAPEVVAFLRACLTPSG